MPYLRDAGQPEQTSLCAMQLGCDLEGRVVTQDAFTRYWLERLQPSEGCGRGDSRPACSKVQLPPGKDKRTLHPARARPFPPPSLLGSAAAVSTELVALRTRRPPGWCCSSHGCIYIQYARQRRLAHPGVATGSNLTAS